MEVLADEAVGPRRGAGLPGGEPGGVGPRVSRETPGRHLGRDHLGRPKSTLSARILGGVPVLNRLRVWPTALRLWERKRAGGSPWRPAGRLFLPYQTTPERKVPPATTTALAGRVRPSTVRTPRSLPLYPEGRHLAPQHLHGPFREDLLGLEGVEVPVHLDPKALHRRALGAVQDPGVDGGGVRRPAHEPAQGHHLRHELAFPRPPHGGVTGHHADPVGVHRHQGHPDPQGGRRPGRPEARVAPSHHHHVVARHPISL